MLKLIKKFAIMSHKNVNHKYGDFPYSYHLSMVVDVANEFINYIPEKDRETILSACWLHDTIEDCRLTYNDVKEVANIEVAEIVYALSNEKGKNRKERANDKYYKGIRDTQYASFVKLCDRIANAKHSKKEKSKMFEVYQKENDNFIDQLFPNNIIGNIFEVLALNALGDVFECDSSETVA
jgi:(p)ppGpp synthase/HD superfamily hydrolase